ncbi:retinol dehydrogenase 13 [Aplysia californica]|uniref:Retinol dehydrogenase 13 n=1 Tax=Aplysia californica TaxID=6500 RepID=A0ABM0K437_APLCA|nr:retinol dehydrogenase 13 [Aplysia californica]
MTLQEYSLPVSVVGTLVALAVFFNFLDFVIGLLLILVPVSCILLKEYMSGGRYYGKERIDGKTVVITGANCGIGKETARDLAGRGGRIIMACRDLEKCEQAKKEIVEETGNKNIECQKLDLASFASIRAFAKLINSTESHVDILINNAGVMMCPKMLTEDGLEMQIGVNHFGHFLLTQLLMDKLKASAPSRIIFVSSLGHTLGKMNFEDLNSEKSYSKLNAYGQSKLANILCSREMARRLEGTGVTVNSLHPGTVSTELTRHLSFWNSSIFKVFAGPFQYILLKTPMQGAQTSITLAVDPRLEKVTGKYFSDCWEKRTARQAEDDGAAKKLWEISEEWTRLKQD